ncbi:MarR family transcriptional regulator [Kibdelosporangium philippinense]|uniref:MarR family transcriptional regulator n=1 Tax=Kibdelosporangium philippinense TaxID=211113 RepID=A0ABS8ZQD5_9PSEU|nr:MarR family transcriptional regulator [Kibdelosporangium philippinense]MCE7009130.1 MarR family transcriptional regulator [Kibdelosporangium philippinense]
MDDLAATMESVVRLVRKLSPATGLSFTAASVLAALDRSGPRRLTELATVEGVSQPAMTQLISRLQDSGFVERVADEHDRRVVQVHITQAGRAQVAYRRQVRAERLAELLARLDPAHHEALTAAIPAINALRGLADDQ